MQKIIIRYLLALLVAFSNNIFYFIFSPLTLYFSFFILNIFYDITIVNSSIVFSDITFNFIPACTAATAYLLITELILLTQGIKIKKAIKMWLIGISSIYLMNIARIIILIQIYLRFGENYFNTVHMLFWHILSTLFVALVWIFLIEKYKVKRIPIYSDIKYLIRKF